MIRQRKVALSVALLAGFALGDASALAAQSGAVVSAGAASADEEEFEEPSLYLPVHGQINSVRTPRSSRVRVIRLDPATVLEGSVEASDTVAPPVQHAYKLTQVALANDPLARKAEQAVARYSQAHQKAIANSKDALNFLICYRGFGPSTQGADVLLEENIKLKSLSAAELVRQKKIDEAHLAVVKALLQLAAGIGTADAGARDRILAPALAELKKHVGEEESRKTLNIISKWSKDIHVPDNVYKTNLWDPYQQEEKLKIAEELAVKNDPLLHKVHKKLKKYNGHSKLGMLTSHIVEGALGAATLAPNLIGPAAQLALTTFEMGTGGPEQDKLIKEIYLYKRLESRGKVLSKKAQLALQNYQLGVVAHNPVQVALSESIIEDMCGREAVHTIFGQSVLDSQVD